MNRVRNIFLTAFCFIRAARYGAARAPIRSPRRIVVIQRAALGDMVCTTPLFAAVKRAFPQAHLAVVGNATNKALLAGNPAVDEYIVWKNFTETGADMTRRKFEVGLLPAPSPDALAALLCAGIPKVIAPRMSHPTPFQTLSYRALLRLCNEVRHTLGSYAPREYLRLLEPLGVFASDTKKYLAFSREAEEKIGHFFDTLHLDNLLKIGIAPGAGAKFKQWPAERFGELAAVLSRKYRAQIFIIGSENDRAEAEMMKRVIPSSVPVVDTVGMWSIDEMKAFIAKLSLFISADTGPVYIAEAFGVPTVDIVGPVDERDQPPRGPQHAVVYDQGRTKPVTGVFTNKFFHYGEARRQAEAIIVPMVVEAVQAVLPT